MRRSRALIGVGIWDQWRIEQAQALHFALSEARAVAAQVDDHIGNLDNLLTGLSQAISLNPADMETQTMPCSNVQWRSNRLYVGNITLFGLDGYSIGSANGSRYYAGDRLYFRNVLEGERLAIGEPVIGRATRAGSLRSPARSRIAQGNLKAVISVATRLEKLQDVLTPRTLPLGSVVRLVNENSVVISDGWNNLNANDAQLRPVMTKKSATSLPRTPPSG